MTDSSAPAEGAAETGVTTFGALGASPAVVEALAARGITSPFPIQQMVVPEGIRGGDILAKSPTGSGKTLSFAVPIVERLSSDGPTPAALILVPTRELCVQVAEDFESIGVSLGLRSAAVYGGVPLKEQADAAAAAHVVVATPGRLQDLMDRRLVDVSYVQILVLDEADRMLDMGFKPQVDKILRRVPQERQTMFFSATLHGEVGELAQRYTHFPARFDAEMPEEFRSGEVEHHFVSVTTDNKVTKLVEILKGYEGSTLIFVRTKSGADRLVEKLVKHGVQAVSIHGDKNQTQRDKALEQFDAGNTRVLVATDVAARGLDVDRVTHVVNFDPPDEAANYTHRVGRTGRAGRSGTGITLVLPDQEADVSRVARLQGHTEAFEASGMKSAPPRVLYTSRKGRRSRW
ncbi:MAG: DEAD/DEAH box helicase [Actinobacteria bacterium]|uniref:Unannotated protein n=1 Tax=freshwater metagenome TaxID=449393 RepID=A0A6J6P6G1_9ZZZZ|nr:DEAD/DEAH box helicase [Actinomycetota bacterium]